MAPPPVPIQGMNDMASQQRALQSYMDSMFASVPQASGSQQQGSSSSGNGMPQNQANMMQQYNNGTPASLAAPLPIGNNNNNQQAQHQQQQQQQQMFHPGVPTIFQPGANMNAQQQSAPSYSQMLPFAAQQSMPPPPPSQQQQNSQPQQQQAQNAAWANQQKQNMNQKNGGQRQQIFNNQQQQQTLPQQSPQVSQAQLQGQMQQYSQGDFQAMLASLGQPTQTQQTPSQQQQQLPQQQRPNHIPNFPQPASMPQQQPNPQHQAFQSQPQPPPMPIQGSTGSNAQYPPHLQAAFQQLQAAHASHSTPPPGAIQALAAFQQQQQQQAAAAAALAAQQAQQTAAAQQLQQQVQQAQAQMQAHQQANAQAPGLNTPGATPDISLLLKLRQQGVQLSADQQLLLSRTMPRRGAVTGDGTPNQNFNNAALPNPMQNQQTSNHQQQQLPQVPSQQPQHQQNMFQSPQMGNQVQLQQQHQQNQQQSRPPLQQQQNPQPMQPGNALSLDIPNMQPVNMQQQARPNPDGSIPLSILQEFTQMNDHLRQMTAQEGHLQACLAQNLYLPYNKPGQPLPPGTAQPTPQPLTPQHREHFQKQMEQLRRIHAQVRDNLAKIEENWGGKDNIISNLKVMAYQRQMQQGGNGSMQIDPQQQQQMQQQQHGQPQQTVPQPPQNQQQQQPPFQPNQQAMQIPYQPPQQSQQQNQNQNQNQNLNQQPQQQPQQSQEAAQLQKLLNRQQMRTPANNLQQQNLQQSTPPQPQAASLPQPPPQQQNQQQQQQVPPHMQQQPQQVQQQGYPVPQNAAAAQAQAQLQRVVQMQQNQMANGLQNSPGSNMRNLPPGMPHQSQGQLSPLLDEASLQQQQHHGQRSNSDGQHHQGYAHQHASSQMQAASVTEEILKTLTNAGPQTFMKALIDTMKHRGTPLTTFPKVDGKEVDLFRLYKVVQQRGGSAVIRQKGLWRQVALETGIPVSAESSQRVFDQMSKVYGDFLEAFEDTQRRAAYATVSKHSLSQMPPPIMQPVKVEQQQQPHQQPQQQAQQQQQHVQQQVPLQQPQQQPQQPIQQQQQPQQINLQNQQYQQQQYLQNIQQMQAQAQAALQGPNTPQQGQKQLPAHQAQQMRPAQPAQIVQNVEAPQQVQQQQQSKQVQNQSRQISPATQQQNAQSMQNRLPNLPAQADVTKARADIEAWKATLMQSKLKCARLDDFNPADVEPFISMAMNLSPMVDRIIELLPLYLAISKQHHGAHTLLVMLFMFREQLSLLERREFILRINDLEKLKMQMQRCWTFVSGYTSGNATNTQPIPNTEIPSNVTNIPAPGTTEYQPQQQRQQDVPAGTPEFVGATMKAGIKVEDLKPPPIKKRRTGSPTDTPPNNTAQAQSNAVAGNGSDQNGAAGTGTYASPVVLDSPPIPAKKTLPMLEGQGQPMAAKPKATKKAGVQNKPAPPAPVPASPNKPTKSKAKKAAAQQPVTKDISVPEISLAITPAATPLVQQYDVQMPPQQQEETLKRKRELDDAQSDPAAFAERMFTSLLSTGNVDKEDPKQAPMGEVLSSELLAFLNEQALADSPSPSFAEPAMPVPDQGKQRATTQTGGVNLIMDDLMSGNPSQAPTVSRWFQDTPSFTAETPELSQADDPTKTSPPDQEAVVTPTDSLIAGRGRSVSGLLPPSTSTATKSILSSFDQEYEQLFKAATGSAGSSSTTQEGDSPVGLGWSWETGPVQVA